MSVDKTEAFRRGRSEGYFRTRASPPGESLRIIVSANPPGGRYRSKSPLSATTVGRRAANELRSSGVRANRRRNRYRSAAPARMSLSASSGTRSSGGSATGILPGASPAPGTAVDYTLSRVFHHFYSRADLRRDFLFQNQRQSMAGQLFEVAQIPATRRRRTWPMSFNGLRECPQIYKSSRSAVYRSLC